MGEEGEERPMDKYYRFKRNIQLWYDEMTKFVARSNKIMELFNKYKKLQYSNS